MASTRYPQRVRNDLRFRELNVLRTERVSAGFQRIVLGGEALEGFSSRGFDDHTKVFFPAPGTTFVPPVVTDEGIDWGDGVRPQARDYTPLYDDEKHELALDFFVHDGGIASNWAVEAKVGDKLTIGGPRGSLVVPEDYAWQLYVCDESGMPALRRRLEGIAKLPVPGDPRHRHRGRCGVSGLSGAPERVQHHLGYRPQRAGGSRPSCSAGRAGRGLLYLADRRGEGGETPEPSV